MKGMVEGFEVCSGMRHKFDRAQFPHVERAAKAVGSMEAQVWYGAGRPVVW